MIAAQAEGGYQSLLKIPGMAEETAERLYKEGFKSVSTIASADSQMLAAIPGIDEQTALAWIEEAGKIIAEEAGGNKV
jgi:ERCC4-type nuclease